MVKIKEKAPKFDWKKVMLVAGEKIVQKTPKTKVWHFLIFYFMRNLVLLFLGILSSFSSFAQIPDSTYIYDKNGIKHWYHIQEDVFSFVLLNEAQYSGVLESCVDTLKYWQNASTKLNELKFDPNSSFVCRDTQIVLIENLSDFVVPSIALTDDPNATYIDNKYYRTDDKILVTFNDLVIDSIVLNDFQNHYSLELVHEPSDLLPNSVSWTYIFRMKQMLPFAKTTIGLAQFMNEFDRRLVKLAEPNMYSVEPLTCQPTTEMDLTPGNINGTWHIRNTGGVIWNGQSGSDDADADLCECWGEGYTGEGVKMGIIDFGGIEFSHDDFEGSNIPKAYNVDDDEYENTDFTLQNNGHAMQVTGMVAATPNNTSLGQRWAVGAAYNTEVIPYINQIGGSTTPAATNGQIAQSIQAAVIEGVDIINMSFRVNAALGSIDLQINNAVNTGRPDPNDPNNYLGIICIAGVGNDNIQGSNFPANMPNVIGVGWSNPEDYRSAYTAPGSGGGWTTNSGQGSTYGPPEYNYDVVAPGELLMTTNLSSTGQGDYAIQIGSSFSSPIVASIAAMMLEKNSLLTWNQVRYILRNGAEKVNTSTYDYNMFGIAPGYNEEMFYGRVSCINSIQSTVSVDENEKPVELTVLNLGEDQYKIYTPTSTEKQPYALYDMSGRVLLNGSVNSGSSEIPIDLSNYNSGMYILKIYNSERTILSTKLIK